MRLSGDTKLSYYLSHRDMFDTYNNEINRARTTLFSCMVTITLVIHTSVSVGGPTYYIYYPPEGRSMKYCCLGVFRKEYFT